MDYTFPYDIPSFLRSVRESEAYRGWEKNLDSK